MKPETDTSNRESAERIAAYFDRLWPLLRSITGEGVRRTHDILGELLPLQRIEIPSGTSVFDWVIPQEWEAREAYVVGPDGNRILDLAVNNLHLVNYSVPFRGTTDRAELDSHLHSLPDQPDAIPYVTSYYSPRWGFCLTDRQRRALPEGKYQVVVDTRLFDGSMTLSEAVLPGEEAAEVLISTYTCHPSLANNELSGPLVAAFLYRRLAALPRRRLSYRFVFLPENIGSIAYLHLRGEHLSANVIAGYVLTNIGDRAGFTYKKSQRSDSLADRAALYALARHSEDPHRAVEFEPRGSDERNYCSPGFDLPVGALMRSHFSETPQYHTSLDNRDFIDFECLRRSVDACERICSVLEASEIYRNLKPFGEPFMTRYGLYPTLSKPDSTLNRTLLAHRWLLNQSNGTRDLLSIAERSGFDIMFLAEEAKRLQSVGLLEREHVPRGEGWA